MNRNDTIELRIEEKRAIGCQKKGLSSTPNHWLSPTKWQIGQSGMNHLRLSRCLLGLHEKATMKLHAKQIRG